MTAIRGSGMRLSPVQETEQDWLAWLKKAKKVKNNTEISSLVFIPCESNQAFNWIFKSRSFLLGLYSLSVKFVSLHLARVAHQSTLWLQDPQSGRTRVTTTCGSWTSCKDMDMEWICTRKLKIIFKEKSDHLCFSLIFYFKKESSFWLKRKNLQKFWKLLDKFRSGWLKSGSWKRWFQPLSALSKSSSGKRPSKFLANRLGGIFSQIIKSANPRLRNEKIVRSQTGGF